MTEPQQEPPAKQVAVLWHQSPLGQANIVGVFERRKDAEALLYSDESHQLLARGGYHITMRSLTRHLPNPERRPWP